MEKLSYVQELMIKALLQLLKSNKFREITITQLTQEASIARKTFYLNFKTKEDILQLMLRHLAIEFKEKLYKKKVINLQVLATCFFEFSKVNAHLVQLLISNNLFMVLTNEFEIFIEEEVIGNNMLIQDFELQPSKYAVYYHTAGLCKLLEKWVLSGMIESPKQMGALYAKFVNIEKALD